MSPLLARTCNSAGGSGSHVSPFLSIAPSIPHAPHPILSLSRAPLPYYLLLLEALGLDEFVPEIRTAVLEGDAEHHPITIYEGRRRAADGTQRKQRSACVSMIWVWIHTVW